METTLIDRINTYREQAEAARESAARALTEENREGYLRLAHSWTSLAEELEAGTFGSSRPDAGPAIIRDLAKLSHGDFLPFVERLSAMVWLGDNAGQCVYLNKSLRKFWGVEMADIPRFTWASTLLPEDQDSLFSHVAGAMRTRTPFTVRGRYRRADGVVRVLQTNAEPRLAPNGEFLGMVGVNTDITEA